MRNEIARNADFGVLVSESQNIDITDNFIEANDRSGVMVEFQYRGTENIKIHNNRIQFNGGHGVESNAARAAKVTGNQHIRNRQGDQKISSERFILMK